MSDFSSQLYEVTKRAYKDEKAIEEFLTPVLQRVNTFDDLLETARNSELESELRTSACWLLSNLDNDAAVTTLLAILDDSDSKMREAAANALRRFMRDEVALRLVELLETDPDQEVQVSAAHSLGYTKGKEFLQPLIRKMVNKSEAARLRGMAAESLGNIGDKAAVDALLAMLKDESVQVRFWATYALGQIAEPRTLPALEQMVQDESELTGFGKISDEANRAMQYFHWNTIESSEESESD